MSPETLLGTHHHLAKLTTKTPSLLETKQAEEIKIDEQRSLILYGMMSLEVH